MFRASSQLPRAAIALVILGVGVVSGGMLMQSGRAHPAGAPANAQLLDDVLQRIQRNYVDSLSEDELRERAATGFVRELDDPYSALLTPESYRRVREMTSGHYAGVGVELDERDGAVTIIAPLAGSPAAEAGVRAGDQLVAVDGHSVVGWSMDEVEQRLRGAVGSRVTLELARADSADHLRLTLTRRDVRVHAVQRADLLPDSVGYVRFASFNEDAASELARSIDSLRARGLRALILDLRSNPGGLLDEGVNVSELFLDPGETIVMTRGRLDSDDHEYTDQSPQRWPGLPLVTLVDSGTASAAEIVAGALQDQHRSVLVGAPTYGKGSAQMVFPMPEGRALKLTTELWFTPDGRTIQRDSTSGGITPDVIVRAPATFDPARDSVVQRARVMLRGIRTPEALRGRVPRRAP